MKCPDITINKKLINTKMKFKNSKYVEMFPWILNWTIIAVKIWAIADSDQLKINLFLWVFLLLKWVGQLFSNIAGVRTRLTYITNPPIPPPPPPPPWTMLFVSECTCSMQHISDIFVATLSPSVLAPPTCFYWMSPMKTGLTNIQIYGGKLFRTYPSL